MKSYLRLGLLSLLLFFGACSKEYPQEIDSLTGDSRVAPQVVVYNGVPTLSFKSEDELKRWFISLAPLSGAQQSEKVRVLGVQTYHASFVSVRRELDDALSVRGETYFSSPEYLEWKQRADKYALFPDDPSEVEPIERALSLSESNTANQNGVYLVNGQPTYIQAYKNVQDYIMDEGRGYNLYSLNGLSGLRANNAFAKTRDRKGRLEIRVDKHNYALLLRFSAQRKSGFIITWWDRYSTTYGARLRITNLSHPFEVYKAQGYYGEIYMLLQGATTRQDAPFTLRKLNSGEHKINLWTHELREEILPFGRFILTSDVDDDEFNEACVMKGHMEVWTRGIPEHLSGKDNIDVHIPL